MIKDAGNGLSEAALIHGTERLWRDDAARGADGHQGLGLWFAARVTKMHRGRMIMENSDGGGVVTFQFSES